MADSELNRYRLFHPTYTVTLPDGTKEPHESPNFHIAFKDHESRRQTFAAYTHERKSARMAERLLELADARRRGIALEGSLRQWVDTLSDRQRERLVEMDLIDLRAEAGNVSLTEHLEGRKGDDGAIVEPGYRQAMEARGVTARHVNTTCQRVADILEGCSFRTWRDLIAPGAAARVEVWLGTLRTEGKVQRKDGSPDKKVATITAITANYYIREMRGFCRWLKDQGKAPAVALEALKGFKNAGVESDERRPLSVEEMRLLLDAAVAGPVRQLLAGTERALLYRFAFETGMRPGQIRTLTVANFDLDADPPIVTSHARYVKRRREHVQILRPAMAAELAKLFKSKLPTAAAVRMPNGDHLADMLRDDLADARATWIEAAGKDDKEREARQRSDFLAAVNHKGERAVFYSTRHGHGTALADAGVPEKDIAASMHHASRKTTERYLHTDRKAARSAIEAMPDLAYPVPAVATGTAGAEPTPERHPILRSACATGATGEESGGVKGFGEHGRHIRDSSVKMQKTRDFSGKVQEGLLAELADAVDSKSTARKGISVRLR